MSLSFFFINSPSSVKCNTLHASGQALNLNKNLAIYGHAFISYLVHAARRRTLSSSASASKHGDVQARINVSYL